MLGLLVTCEMYKQPTTNTWETLKTVLEKHFRRKVEFSAQEFWLATPYEIHMELAWSCTCAAVKARHADQIEQQKKGVVPQDKTDRQSCTYDARAPTP